MLPNPPDASTQPARVQPGDVITASLMNQVLSRLDELDRRTLEVRIVPAPLINNAHALVALGGAFGQPSGIWLDDTPLLPSIPNPGINLVILDPTLSVKYWSVYTTGSLPADSDRLVSDLQTFGLSADIIVGVTQDAFADQLSPRARAALAAVGAAVFTSAQPNSDAIAFIGVVPAGGALSFNYLTSDVPVDGQGAGLPFLWGIYSTSLRRFLAGGGAGLGGAPVVVPVAITSFRVTPAQPIVGGSATGTVTLSGQATESMTVTLATGNAQIASLPQPTASIAKGQGSTSFPITIVGAGQVNLTASLPGQDPFMTSLSVDPAPTALSVIQVSLSQTTANPGDTITGTVTLSGAAPAATTVSLSSGNTSVAALPQPTANVDQGQSAASFQVNAVGPGSADIHATLGPSSQITSLTVQKPKDTKEKDGKDTKERKETKDKDAKETKDTKEGGLDKVQREKISALEKVTDRVLPQFMPRGPSRVLSSSVMPTGQAFIRAAERPNVGQQAINTPV
jgi:Interleukin-like EMT inducer